MMTTTMNKLAKIPNHVLLTPFQSVSHITVACLTRSQNPSATTMLRLTRSQPSMIQSTGHSA